MNFETVGENKNITFVRSDGLVISDASSALDLIATVRYETGCDRLIIDKAAVTEDLFVLSRGVAGEILQKFVNYQIKLAVVGNFSKYTSKPLRDFIYESNKGRDFFFVGTFDEAVEKLSR